MKKILLIEDNQDMRENIAEILELANYQVLTAPNGRDGVDLAQSELPDLIICDIMMPVLDGYGVLYLLSRNEKTASIPFIFLSAKAERSDMRKGMELGADDYLSKPFDDIELLNAIESRLKKSEQIKRDFSNTTQGLSEFLESARGFQALKDISAEQESRTYKKKEEIYSEGKQPKGLYFINSGKIKTFRSSEQGKEFTTGLFKEGDFFGYLPMLQDETYNDAATALEDSEITLIPKEDFMSLIFKSPEVSRQFIRLLSDNIDEKEKELIRLAYSSVRKRVAEALVKLHDRFKKEHEENFSISISREDIAALAGTATETTIRTLSDFKEEGLVAIKGGTVTVLNYTKLSNMKN